MLYPLFHNTAIILAVLCWIAGLIFIGTAGKKTTNADGVHTLVYNENMQKVFMYYLFCIIWIVEWMGALGFMVMTSAILIPFFDNKEVTGNEEKKSRWPVIDGFKLVAWNHMGTAAIGSFFITLVVIVRWILTYVMEQAKQSDASGMMKYIAACVQCCMECVENCLRYMLRTAYILTVLEGRWFFSAVCGGLHTIMENMDQIFATNYISWAILWLCKLSVPLGTTFFAHLMIQGGHMGVTAADLSSAFDVLVPVFLISSIFSFTFMGLLDTSIEVCLVAFCKLEDIDNEHPELNIMQCVPQDIREEFEDVRQESQDEESKKGKTGDGEPLINEEETKDPALGHGTQDEDGDRDPEDPEDPDQNG